MNRHPNVLDVSNAVLLIVDVQEAFRKFIPDYADLIKSISILRDAAKILNLPVIITEQYQKGLGKTVDEIISGFIEKKFELVEKDCFSCCGSDQFKDSLKKLGRAQIIVSGIEAHVCVNQTVHDLLVHGYKPHIIVDAISSRYQKNKEVAVQKMTMSGAIPSTVEIALFEMLVQSGTDAFKAVQRLVK